MALVDLRRGALLLVLLSVILFPLALSPASPQLRTEPDPPNRDLGRLEQGEIGVWSFKIINGGGGLLEWSVQSDRSWLSLEPQSGSLKAGEAAEVRVAVATAGLAPGRYQGRIAIDSNGGSRIGLVTVEVLLQNGLADTPWPTFHHDPRRTGRSLLRGPQSPEVRWVVETTGPIWSSPVIGAEGTIYVASVDGWLYALTPEGHERWRLDLGGIITASPAIGRDGTIYIGNNRYLYAIAPEGTILWKAELGRLTASSP
ncbi:MAG: PQQ-binding-like beta-propeller repeat protein, partial [Candidatus Bipolaricaulia bacterium]